MKQEMFKVKSHRYTSSKNIMVLAKTTENAKPTKTVVLGAYDRPPSEPGAVLLKDIS